MACKKDNLSTWSVKSPRIVERAMTSHALSARGIEAWSCLSIHWSNRISVSSNIPSFSHTASRACNKLNLKTARKWTTRGKFQQWRQLKAGYQSLKWGEREVYNSRGVRKMGPQIPHHPTIQSCDCAALVRLSWLDPTFIPPYPPSPLSYSKPFPFCFHPTKKKKRK